MIAKIGRIVVRAVGLAVPRKVDVAARFAARKVFNNRRARARTCNLANNFEERKDRSVYEACCIFAGYFIGVTILLWAITAPIRWLFS